MLHHLDRPSTAQSQHSSQLGGGGGIEEQQPQQATPAPQPAVAPGPAEEDAASPLFHQESISRVSSLGESMMQEAAALSLHDPQQQEQQEADQQQPLLLQDAATGAVAPQSTADLLATPASLQGPETAHACTGLLPAETGCESGAARRLSRPLPVLRVVGGKEGGTGRRHSASTAADTTGGHQWRPSPR